MKCERCGEPCQRCGELPARIRDPIAYRLQTDLDILTPAFRGTNIKPADIDGAIWNTGGVVETKGSVLFVEFKGPSGEVPLGQDLLFRTLCAPTGFLVLVISGPRNTPQRYCFWTPDGEGNWRDCDLKSLNELVRRWFLSVRNNGISSALITGGLGGDGGSQELRPLG